VVRWSADSRAVVFTSRSNTQPERLLCDVATGIVTKRTLAAELCLGSEGASTAFEKAPYVDLLSGQRMARPEVLDNLQCSCYAGITLT